jgi:phosphinothricin acetyltransferase
MGPTATIRPATAADLPAINAIYNREVREGVATWDEAPWTTEDRARWFAEHTADPTQPVLVTERDGAVAGFACLSLLSSRTGYRFTREDTLYIEPAYHRRGLGIALLDALIAHARADGMHALVAKIEAGNAASLALHARCGFTHAGAQPELGFKFGRWLDLVTMQRLL